MARTPPPPLENNNPVTPPASGRPAEPEVEQQQPQPRAEVAAAQDGLLEGLLADKPNGGVTADQVFGGLARLRTKTVDPMTDFVSDSTRKLKFVKAAIDHVAALTDRTLQDVETALLLGGGDEEQQLHDLFRKLLVVHFVDLYDRQPPWLDVPDSDD